ncbi:MAG: efflux RND transporter permease subunit [Bdellovibrionales bacterium]|nr:efflux RND transporter permease subunit [Bdellovibrionales bacterium]
MLKVSPNYDFLRPLGISAKEVLNTVAIAVGGHDAGYVFDGVKRFPIIVKLDESVRSNLDAIRMLPVETGERASVPLKQAAKIQFEETLGTINREESKRRVAVLINPRGVDTESFVFAAQKKVAESVEIPPGYYVEWGGNFKNLNEARVRLMIFAPLAFLLVLAMVFWAFKSIPQTFLVLIGVPLALVGGVLGLKANGLPFSITAGVGFIALAGISVLNGVVLINCFNDLQAKGLRGIELVRKGTALRIRPVLMTALVAIFGFIPMMLSTGVGAEVQRPLASVVIGGLISSTALTLLVLPCVYLMFERFMSSAVTSGETSSQDT